MKELIPIEVIESKILLIRGKKVMLASDLATLYQVTTGNLNKAVARNADRFPEDFMFRLGDEEYEALRFHFGILKQGAHSKYLPYAFTEHGILMLSSVLQSKRAVHVNIQIMRTFTKLRALLRSNEEIRKKIEEMEKKYDRQFQAVFEAIKRILEPPPPDPPKRQIGFYRY